MLHGLRAASQAYGVPVLGGHTTVDVPASLAVTALGTTPQPVPAGGGRPGHRVRLTADLDGAWRPGYTGRQFDTTSRRRSRGPPRDGERHRAGRPLPAGRRPRTSRWRASSGPSGCSPRPAAPAPSSTWRPCPGPADAGVADWFTCFPGFALLTTDVPGSPLPDAGPATGAECGALTDTPGVALRWPDGETTPAVVGPVTGLGPATGHERTR